MTAKVTHGIIDHSGETSTVAFHLPAVDNTNYEDVAGNGVGENVGDLRIALSDITIGNFTRHTVTSVIYPEAGTPPTDPYAQRELKALFTYIDNVTNKKYNFAVPCPDLSVIAQQNTDVLDLVSNVVLAAFVSAVEGNAVSQEGNAISVISGRIVGRNN